MDNTTLPACIDTEEKQRQVAEDLARRHLNLSVKSSQLLSMQGNFSKTVEVVVGDGQTIIIQLRMEPLDVGPFVRARQLLGDDLIPLIQPIDDNEILLTNKISAYYMTRIPGDPWLVLESDWDEELLVRGAESLGRVLSRCFLPPESDKAVISRTTHVLLHELLNILSIKTRSGHDVSQFFPTVQRLIANAHRLNELPRFFSHDDLNPMNVLVNEKGDVTGIVDWESARNLPFGVSCWCILFFAGQFLTAENGAIEFVERPIFEKMDRAFWSQLLGGNSPDAHIRASLEGKMELVQLAVITGLVLRVLGVFQIDGVDSDGIHVPSLKTLSRLLTYRIPPLRGSDKAFGHQLNLEAGSC
jgi:hypothetical protein